jgi:DNA mismatch repair protein MSH5
MDDHFGDVYGIISDREIEISYELAQYVLQYEQLLMSCSDVCGELDRFGCQSMQICSVLTLTVAC